MPHARLVPSRRPLLAVAALVTCGALVAVGCATKPVSSRDVDPSVLPAAAKALFTANAQVTAVKEVTYTKGTRVYLIDYTVDGRPEQIAYNTRDKSTPTGVFEFGIFGDKPQPATKRAEAIPDTLKTPTNEPMPKEPMTDERVPASN